MTRKTSSGACALPDRDVLEIIDGTQHWIAQRLHDTTCQSLCGVAFLAGALQHKLSAGQGGDIAAEFRELQKGLEHALDETQTVVRFLRPKIAGDLKATLSAIADEISQKIPCDLKYAPTGTQPAPFVAAQLASIARELLTRLFLCRGVRGFSIGFKTAGKRGRLTIRAKGTRFKMPAFGTKYSFNRHLLDLRLAAIGGEMEIKAGEVVVVCGLLER